MEEPQEAVWSSSTDEVLFFFYRKRTPPKVQSGLKFLHWWCFFFMLNRQKTRTNERPNDVTHDAHAIRNDVWYQSKWCLSIEIMYINRTMYLNRNDVIHTKDAHTIRNDVWCQTKWWIISYEMIISMEMMYHKKWCTKYHTKWCDTQIRQRELLRDADLRLAAGKRYGLLGPNGRGKSTLLRFLAARELPVPAAVDVLLVEQEVCCVFVTFLFCCVCCVFVLFLFCFLFAVFFVLFFVFMLCFCFI